MDRLHARRGSPAPVQPLAYTLRRMSAPADAGPPAIFHTRHNCASIPPPPLAARVSVRSSPPTCKRPNNSAPDGATSRAGSRPSNERKGTLAPAPARTARHRVDVAVPLHTLTQQADARTLLATLVSVRQTPQSNPPAPRVDHPQPRAQLQAPVPMLDRTPHLADAHGQGVRPTHGQDSLLAQSARQRRFAKHAASDKEQTIACKEDWRTAWAAAQESAPVTATLQLHGQWNVLRREAQERLNGTHRRDAA